MISFNKLISIKCTYISVWSFLTIGCNYHSSYKIFQSPQKVPSYPFPLKPLLFQPLSDLHHHRSAFKPTSKETPPDSMPHEYRDCQAAPSSEAKGLQPPPTLLPGIPTPYRLQALHDRTAGSTNSAGNKHRTWSQRIWARVLGLHNDQSKSLNLLESLVP